MTFKQGLAFLLSAALALALLAADLYILSMPGVAGPRIRKLLQDRLGGSVSIGEIDLQQIGLVTCNNLRIRPPRHLGPDDEIHLRHLQIAYTGSFATGIRPTRVQVDGASILAGRESLAYWVKRLSANGGDTPFDLPVVRLDRIRIQTDIPELFVPGNSPELDDVRLLLQPLDDGGILADASIGSGLPGAWTVRAEYSPVRDTLEVVARGDADIREAYTRRMSPALFAIWDKYRVEGRMRIDGRVRLRFPPAGTPELEDWSVQAAFDRTEGRKASGRFKPFPYPLHALEGTIDFLPAGVRIRDLRGRTAEGEAFVRGSSSGYPAESALDIHVRLTRLRLDDTLRDASPPELRGLWRELALDGLIDAELHVTRDEGPDRPEHYRALLRPIGASIRHVAFPYPIDGITGEVFYNDGEVILRHLDGRHGDATIHIAGRLAAIDKPDAAIALEVTGRNVPFDGDLRAALMQDIVPIWESLSPTGRTDILWKLERPPGPGARAQNRVELRLRGAGAVVRSFPLPLSNLRGVAVYDASGVDLQFIEGSYRDAPFTLRGAVTGAGAAKDIRLDIKAERIPVDDAFRTELPAESRGLVDQLGLRGRVDAEVRLAYRDEPNRPIVGSYTAEVRLRDAGLEERFPASHLHGRINVEGELRPEGNTASGLFKITQARLAQKRVTDLGALFRMAGGRIHFFDVRGTAYDGIVHVPFLEAVAETGAYEGHGRLEGVDLSLFVRDTALAGRPLAGRLSGEIDFSGISGRLETLRGRGRVQITDGYLWDVPLLLQLVRVLNLGPLPSQEAFHTGDVRFHIADQRIWLDDFLFSSDSVTLSGTGWVKFNGKLDLMIDSEFSSTILGQIPGLSQLIDILKRNIVAVRARGTFENPDLNLKAFPLKDFQPEPDDDAK